MRQRFLQENHRGVYSYMLLSETIWKHLAEIDEESNEMMDSIRSRAEEVVLHDLIYSL